jgi:phthiocerol/phenolphthiocerol synthesis type-I polyketide synthase E
MNHHTTDSRASGLEIAIIGMAGRFPGAKDVEAFWRNLCEGVESVSVLTDEDLLASGVNQALLQDSNYVKARAVLDEIDLFDAAFFGVTAREAETMDPQQRLFLECAWEALEHAGCNPEVYEGLIGVYTGASASGYAGLISQSTLLQSAVDMSVVLGTDQDFLSSRVSYKLNLEGPSLVVQTACSSSLVAVHLACQGLLSGECDMALAGGVSISVPQKVGYLYQEGAIASSDGHCRTFDAAAQGTVGGSGLGIVVLKRLQEALADGDHILAVIKGSAVNNDGALKVGFTAPRIEGQAKVIQSAHAAADVDPESIT